MTKIRRPAPLNFACIAKCASLAAIVWILAAPAPSRAAVTWDADNGTRWWFDPVNWRTGDPQVNNVLPPSNNAGTGITDTQINIGPGPWDLGEGVVYDPTNDPNFLTAGSITRPDGFSLQAIQQLYISRAQPNNNLLTIKGDLEIRGQVIIGRSSGTRNVASNGRINQVLGKVTVNTGAFDLGQTDTGTNPPANGYGNGTYDYRSGILEIGLPLGTGLRTSSGTASNAADGSPAGTGGVGRFIMHNPTTGGYVHMSNISLASFPGVNDGVVDDKDPNGTTKGVGILEFHYENGKTRPIQLDGNLSLNNGVDPVTLATRSSRLDLRLSEPVTLNGNAPINLGLVDVDFLPEDFIAGVVQGTGSKGGTFDSGDGLINYAEGSLVSATFGSTTYNWRISYHGKIEWSDPANSVVSSVSTGTVDIDQDVVLIGDSVTVVIEDADFDADGDIDGADFLAWQRNNGTAAGATLAMGDANSDGKVNAADLSIWRNQFATAVVAGGAVPEPATIKMLACALVAAPLACRGRRHEFDAQ